MHVFNKCIGVVFHCHFFWQKDVPTITTLQMRVEASVKNHVWATNMTKHVMVINKQLKSTLLGMMQHRLFRPNNINLRKTSTKKPKI